MLVVLLMMLSARMITLMITLSWQRHEDRYQDRQLSPAWDDQIKLLLILTSLMRSSFSCCLLGREAPQKKTDSNEHYPKGRVVSSNPETRSRFSGNICHYIRKYSLKSCFKELSNICAQKFLFDLGESSHFAISICLFTLRLASADFHNNLPKASACS